MAENDSRIELAFLIAAVLVNPVAASDLGSPPNALVISDTGNIGIGTTAPDEKFHIKDGNLKVEQTNAGVSAVFEFLTANSDRFF